MMCKYQVKRIEGVITTKMVLRRIIQNHEEIQTLCNEVLYHTFNIQC